MAGWCRAPGRSFSLWALVSSTILDRQEVIVAGERFLACAGLFWRQIKAGLWEMGAPELFAPLLKEREGGQALLFC